MPSAQTIKTRRYPLARSLFIYARCDRVIRRRAVKEFIRRIMDQSVPNAEALLVQHGLIPVEGKTRVREIAAFYRRCGEDLLS
jgi:hypothetical protein